MSTALKLNVPAQGQKITIANGKLAVPDQPIIPFMTLQTIPLVPSVKVPYGGT